MSLSSIQHSIDHTEQASRTSATCSLPEQSEKVLLNMRARERWGSEMRGERARGRDRERQNERER